MEDGRFTIEMVEVGGRALKETNIHEKLMELLMRTSPPRVFDSLTPTKFLELIKIQEGMYVKDIMDLFYKCFDAFGNLAEKCGSITIQVEALLEDGIDKNWLINAVEEPIEEAGIRLEKEEK